MEAQIKLPLLKGFNTRDVQALTSPGPRRNLEPIQRAVFKYAWRNLCFQGNPADANAVARHRASNIPADDVCANIVAQFRAIQEGATLWYLHQKGAMTAEGLGVWEAGSDFHFWLCTHLHAEAVFLKRPIPLLDREHALFPRVDDYLVQYSREGESLTTSYSINPRMPTNPKPIIEAAGQRDVRLYLDPTRSGRWQDIWRNVNWIGAHEEVFEWAVCEATKGDRSLYMAYLGFNRQHPKSPEQFAGWVSAHLEDWRDVRHIYKEQTVVPKWERFDIENDGNSPPTTFPDGQLLQMIIYDLNLTGFDIRPSTLAEIKVHQFEKVNHAFRGTQTKGYQFPKISVSKKCEPWDPNMRRTGGHGGGERMEQWNELDLEHRRYYLSRGDYDRGNGDTGLGQIDGRLPFAVFAHILVRHFEARYLGSDISQWAIWMAISENLLHLSVAHLQVWVRFWYQHLGITLPWDEQCRYILILRFWRAIAAWTEKGRLIFTTDPNKKDVSVRDFLQDELVGEPDPEELTGKLPTNVARPIMRTSQSVSLSRGRATRKLKTLLANIVADGEDSEPAARHTSSSRDSSSSRDNSSSRDSSSSRAISPPEEQDPPTQSELTRPPRAHPVAQPTSPTNPSTGVLADTPQGAVLGATVSPTTMTREEPKELTEEEQIQRRRDLRRQLKQRGGRQASNPFFSGMKKSAQSVANPVATDPAATNPAQKPPTMPTTTAREPEDRHLSSLVPSKHTLSDLDSHEETSPKLPERRLVAEQGKAALDKDKRSVDEKVQGDALPAVQQEIKGEIRATGAQDPVVNEDKVISPVAADPLQIPHTGSAPVRDPDGETAKEEVSQSLQSLDQQLGAALSRIQELEAQQKELTRARFTALEGEIQTLQSKVDSAEAATQRAQQMAQTQSNQSAHYKNEAESARKQASDAEAELAQTKAASSQRQTEHDALISAAKERDTAANAEIVELKSKLANLTNLKSVSDQDLAKAHSDFARNEKHRQQLQTSLSNLQQHYGKTEYARSESVKNHDVDKIRLQHFVPALYEARTELDRHKFLLDKHAPEDIRESFSTMLAQDKALTEALRNRKSVKSLDIPFDMYTHIENIRIDLQEKDLRIRKLQLAFDTAEDRAVKAVAPEKQDKVANIFADVRKASNKGVPVFAPVESRSNGADTLPLVEPRPVEKMAPAGETKTSHTIRYESQRLAKSHGLPRKSSFVETPSPPSGPLDTQPVPADCPPEQLGQGEALLLDGTKSEFPPPQYVKYE